MALPNDLQRLKTNLKHARILVVEDNADHWTLIKNAMRQSLPEVNLVWVSSAVEALDLLTEWSTQEWELPKLILQDLYLPQSEDGWHLLRQIKSMGASCSRIPVILLSGSAQQPDVETAYQQGATSYLIKPIDFAGWVECFNELRSYWWETVSLPPMQFNT